MTRWPLAPGALSHYEWIGMLIARLSVGVTLRAVRQRQTLRAVSSGRDG